MTSSAPAWSTEVRTRGSPSPVMHSRYCSDDSRSCSKRGRPSGDGRKESTTRTSGENDRASMSAASPSVGALTQNPAERRPATAIRRASGSFTAIRIRGEMLMSWSMSAFTGSAEPDSSSSMWPNGRAGLVSVDSEMNSSRNFTQREHRRRRGATTRREHRSIRCHLVQRRHDARTTPRRRGGASGAR